MKALLLIANVLLVAGITLVAFQVRTHDASSREEFDGTENHDFVRGDANDDDRVDVSDVVFGLSSLFRGGELPECLAAADTNDDGEIDVADSIWTLNYMFRGGLQPPAPFPLAGEDPTPDLGCRGPALPQIPGVGDYGGPDRVLTAEEEFSWRRGREIFNKPFDVGDGLGPRFNGDSCRGCHLDPVIGGAGGLDLDVVRFAHVDEFDVVTQLPTGPASSRHELPGVTHDEVHIDANVIETRQTPTLLGLGAVDRVPDATILANADPNDVDADGISGRARMVDGLVGRFGHKSGVPSLRDFAADAMFNEIGITIDLINTPFAGESDTDSAVDPELSDAEFADLVFFLEHLAPPPRDIPSDPDDAARVSKGEENFVTVGCANCHVPSLAGPDGPVAAYSDFLLHDVANPARYNVTEGTIDPREFRTAPLWGLRDTAPYLHDGSASSIPDAIRDGHFGEAAAAKAAYQALSFDERSKLVEFVESL